MTDDSETTIRVLHDEALAQDWELVLLAQGLSPRMQRTPDGIALMVPRHEVGRALAGLAAYEKENSGRAIPQTPAQPLDLRSGALAGSLLIGFFAVTSWRPAPLWLERGSANAARILDGELWRAVTALTLHADAAHAVSNGFAMAVFFGAVSAQLGVGVASALILLSGAGGNLANAYLQGSPHDAVGASTALFGAVGLLGSLAMMRRRRALGDKRRAWVTLAAALALLGMLGSGGARVDVLAHLWGFLLGGLLGIPTGLFAARPASVAVQWSCGSATLMTLLYCWWLALN
jgi:membrane associated rhomboid family serine protease